MSGYALTAANGKGDAVVLRGERRTSDRKVAGLTPARPLLAQQP